MAGIMDIRRIAINIFSNWTFFVLMIGVSFFVSPILVHSLGDEQYGTWVLIGSIVGYFAVMDFGLMTALVRYISKYDAQEEPEKSRSIYSNACMFFVLVGIIIAIICVVIAFFFPLMFEINTLSRGYVYWVFLFAGLELAALMGTGMFSGVLHAKQDFVWLNGINILVLVVKNIILVVMLLNGFNLMTVALIHLFATILRSILRYLVIKKRHPHLDFKKSDLQKTIIKKIFGYSVYSFMIAFSIKVLFFTDSIVLGSMVSVAAVTFYAIPMTLMTYLEQIVTVGMSVFTPVISSNEAVGENEKNRNIYFWGSRYALMLSLPVVFVLYTNGDSFISLWMGEEYGLKSTSLLRILCVGYVFYLSQVIATELLKGISRHKFIAYVFAVEAVLNLLLSVILIKFFGFGIEGAAYGTMVPLVVVNFLIVPLYVCKLMSLNYLSYILKTYFPLLSFTMFGGFFYFYVYPFRATSYLEIAFFASVVSIVYAIFSITVVIDKDHKRKIFAKFICRQ